MTLNKTAWSEISHCTSVTPLTENRGSSLGPTAAQLPCVYCSPLCVVILSYLSEFSSFFFFFFF